MKNHFPAIKVCGLRDPANIEDVISTHPQYIGFIFYPLSARFAGELNPEYIGSIKNVKKTAVFVNASFQEIKIILDKCQFDAVQLHGNESPEFCMQIKKMGVELIKAFGVDSHFDFNRLADYIPVADYFLFDTKTSIYGGSGKSFNWEILKMYPYSKPYFLSGGIGPENFWEAFTFKDDRLYAIDLNSRFETSPGIKNITLLKQVLNNKIDNE